MLVPFCVRRGGELECKLYEVDSARLSELVRVAPEAAGRLADRLVRADWSAIGELIELIGAEPVAEADVSEVDLESAAVRLGRAVASLLGAEAAAEAVEAARICPRCVGAAVGELRRMLGDLEELERLEERIGEELRELWRRAPW